MKETERIIRLLKKTFEKGAWYGPSVKEVLDQLHEGSADKRLQNTHSIAELINHMTAWRTFVIHKINGDPDYQVDDERNFPDSSDWKKAIAGLEKSQQELINAIQLLPDSRLGELVPHVQYRYTFYTLLHGIIHHDIYHLGQIQLINKAVR